MIGFSGAGLVAYSTPNATSIEKPLDENQISWFVSVIMITNFGFCMLSGFINDLLGRKKSLALSQLFYCSGWICMYFSTNFIGLIIGRCLSGAGMGLGFPSTTMYLSEISLIKHRGILSLVNSVTYNFFAMVCLALAANLPFDWLLIISALPSCLFLILSFTIPESPIWYASKSRMEDAKTSLERLRGSKYNSKAELDEMEVILASKGHWKEDIMELKQRKIFCPILLLMALIFFQSFSGAVIITDYAIEVFRRAKLKYDHYFLSILCTSFTTAGYVTSTFLTTKVSRKLQFCFGGSSMALNLLLSGLILKLMESGNSFIESFGDILLPTCMIIACFSYGLGVGPIPFALLGEIVPQRIKAVASALVLTTRHLSFFVLMKFFPIFATTFGLHSAFWFHTGILTVAVTFAYFAIPETRGKTLTELSNLFDKK